MCIIIRGERVRIKPHILLDHNRRLPAPPTVCISVKWHVWPLLDGIWGVLQDRWIIQVLLDPAHASLEQSDWALR